MFQILYDARKFNEYPKILFSLAKFSQKLLQNIMTMFCEITSALNEQLIYLNHCRVVTPDIDTNLGQYMYWLR